jgi:type IV pilus assembly protein PilM
MFSFFGSQGLLAVDIGTSSIKLAEIQVSRKQSTLSRFQVVSLPPGAVEGGEIRDALTVGQTLQGALSQRQFKRKQAVSAVWGSSVMIKKITMPRVEEKFIKDSIRFEAEQNIPFDPAEIALDHVRLTSKGTEGIDVLLVAGKQENIFQVVGVLEEAGLKCAVVDVGSLALANSYEANYGKSPGIVTLINFGAGVVSFVVIENGEVQICRDLPIGGATYTTEISKTMRQSYTEAESMKLSAAMGQPTPPEVMEIIGAVNEQVIDDIAKTFEFVSTVGGLAVGQGQVLVTGGAIGTPGLLEGLERSIGLRPEVFDPFLRVRPDGKVMQSDYVQQIRNVAAVAVGLGLRQAKEK